MNKKLFTYRKMRWLGPIFGTFHDLLPDCNHVTTWHSEYIALCPHSLTFLSKVHTFLTKVHLIWGTKITLIAVKSNFVVQKWNHTNERDWFMYIAKNSNV